MQFENSTDEDLNLPKKKIVIIKKMQKLSKLISLMIYSSAKNKGIHTLHKVKAKNKQYLRHVTYRVRYTQTMMSRQVRKSLL